MTLFVYGKLGVFYLGRKVGDTNRQDTDELVMYDARDLTTHAVCGYDRQRQDRSVSELVGRTAIDGVPVIAIDPKGDIANLALQFPQLRAEDFLPGWMPVRLSARVSRPKSLLLPPPRPGKKA